MGEILALVYRLLGWARQTIGTRNFIIVLISATTALVSAVGVNVYFLYRIEPTLTINTKQLCVTDRAGRCRASLEMQADDSPCLVLLDRDLKDRASLCLNSEGVVSVNW